MKPTLIEAEGPVNAWLKAVRFLVENGDAFNVIINIENPLGFEDLELGFYDPRKGLRTARSVEDVANTIFPKRSPKWNLADSEFASYYYRAYRRLLHKGPRSWGMYFLRLIDFGSKHVNQLEKIIHGLGGWGRNHKAAFVIHFSSSETDSPRPLGAPCLQFCEFVREGDTLSLVAVYRSHDYYLKALGNFIGLSRLLQYVSERTGIPIGSIICHSTYAYLAINRNRAITLISEV